MTAAAAIDVPVERALAFVAGEFAVSAALLANPRRRAGLVRPRALFAWALRQHNVSFPRIAAALGRERDGAVTLFKIACDLRRVDRDFAACCDRYAAHAGMHRG